MTEVLADMREKVIEHALVMATRSKGGIALKFTSPGFVGMPDRLVLLPHGRTGFVELTVAARPAQTASAAWIQGVCD